MKNNIIRYSLIVLLIGLVALPTSRANAQGNQKEKHVELLSASWGFSHGQTVRFSVMLRRLANPRLPADPVNARIQLLDTEGEVIAQSDEIKVAPGQIRFWDAPRDLLPAAGETGTGRLQVRTRILVTTKLFDFDPNQPPLAPTMELIDPGTGRTFVLITVEWVFVAT